MKDQKRLQRIKEIKYDLKHLKQLEEEEYLRDRLEEELLVELEELEGSAEKKN